MSLPFPLFVLAIAARTAIVLIVLGAGIRLFGRRGVGELNLLDLVMILMIGNAVQNAITTGSGSLIVGMVSAATLLVLDWLYGLISSRQPKWQEKISGDPVVIATNGKLDHRAMNRQGVNEDQVHAAIREMGLYDLNEVRLVVLEENGAISIIPKEKK